MSPFSTVRQKGFSLEAGFGYPIATHPTTSRGIHVSDPDPTKDQDVPSDKPDLVPPRDIITGSFSRGADLLSYLVSGVLIGLFADWVFGTSPIMVVLWTLAALILGYWRLWQSSEILEEEGKARSHGV